MYTETHSVDIVPRALSTLSVITIYLKEWRPSDQVYVFRYFSTIEDRLSHFQRSAIVDGVYRERTVYEPRVPESHPGDLWVREIPVPAEPFRFPSLSYSPGKGGQDTRGTPYLKRL